jgi:hypothetical protein
MRHGCYNLFDVLTDLFIYYPYRVAGLLQEYAYLLFP